jgi:hypothetical protein
MMMVVAMMMVVVMMMRGAHRLCAWNREGNSGDGGQCESKFSHENYSLAGFLSSQKDGEGICSRQIDIYEWSFRKSVFRQRIAACQKVEAITTTGRGLRSAFREGEAANRGGLIRRSEQY